MVLTSVFLSAFAAFSAAQNGTNSPYTRFGYGVLSERSSGASRAMGGSGIGLRSSKQINPMNPASYSIIDSMTFLFDFGASVQMSWLSDGTNNQNDINGNVEYMAMKFPLHKTIAMSAGLRPYTHVGYSFGEVKTSDGISYSEVFSGTGGLNQLYAGLSIDIWKKRLSVGANINYLFGTINHTAIMSYNVSSAEVYNNNRHKLSGATVDLGLQYTHPLDKTNSMTFGLIYTPKKRLNSNVYESVSDENGSLNIDTISDLAYDIPNDYGIGVSFTKKDKLMALADFSYQDWSNISFAGKENEFKNRIRVSGGVEYIPNLYSRPYFNRIRYRAGVSYTNSYIQVNTSGYKEYGATLGFGFPISDARSYVNLSIEYVKIKPDNNIMINEDHLRVTLSYTFNENWFFKRKVE